MDVTLFERPRPRTPDRDRRDEPDARSSQAVDARVAAVAGTLAPRRSSAAPPRAVAGAPEEAVAGGRSANREQILTRYRHLRELSVRFQSEALDKVSKAAFLDRARQIGLLWRDVIVADSEEELTLIFDLALYTAPAGRSRAVDRYARQMRPTAGPDEAAMLDTMCRARFSIWCVERRHQSAGLVLRDLFRKQSVWLVDEGLEQTVIPGGLFASRVIVPGDFAMTCGVVLPVDLDMLQEAVAEVHDRLRGDRVRMADDRRFAVAVYRLAVVLGVMDDVAFI